MRASSSSSSNSLAATSLNNRLKTIYKKASELSILCRVAVSVIYYGPNGELKTWPKEKEVVKDMALKYKAATKRKNSYNLRDFLEGKLDNDKNLKDNKKKKKKTKREFENVKYPEWYPALDHYSPDQLRQLILSLQGTLSSMEERIRVLQVQKQKSTNLVHQNLTKHRHDHYQTVQPLNSSQCSLYLYNHDDATLSELPLSAAHSNQLINYQNYLRMQQQKHYDPCVANTQDHPALLSVQESRLKNQFMKQQERNMCMMNNTSNSNVLLHPCPLNTIPKELSFDLQKNPKDDMVGRHKFSQDFPNLFLAYADSPQLQTSLPSIHQTIPNINLIPDNSSCL
ncbi:AGAMOUS-like 78 [Raphanus sativus]|uniref:Agamous-like MADS-box protein AGL75 n=1 Tax=Raphanus sativus TaxID=3726 RepID=A0A6J0JIU3_RAPSA|nr:agamous-like MADS-box protein AGL75 [Raphanus sativus]KAJ4887607.1 AGAMOUS-like 78 [Raphanus sativus]